MGVLVALVTARTRPQSRGTRRCTGARPRAAAVGDIVSQRVLGWVFVTSLVAGLVVMLRFVGPLTRILGVSPACSRSSSPACF
jgi:hypothetical protein